MELTKDTENIDDLDSNFCQKPTNFLRNRLHILDPRQWEFDLKEAKRTIRSQTDSNQSNEMMRNGSKNALCSVLSKLWWEEYIPFDLFNNLTYQEKWVDGVWGNWLGIICS